VASIRVDRLTKSYGSSVVLKELSLEIADGEFVVLVGPSGCGKSTTLRMLAGLEDVDAGRVLIGDRDVTHLASKDRDIAMVFQNYALYPHMTVYRNMAFGLELRRVPKAEIRQRVEAAAKVLEIGHLLDRKPKELSGGQKQRVAVGRAIVREPAAFLFDEPLSNLDAKLRVTTCAELKRLHQRLRTTTIYVTHDQDEDHRRRNQHGTEDALLLEEVSPAPPWADQTPRYRCHAAILSEVDSGGGRFWPRFSSTS
jgi:multiple sugar transport system ATP-binding protein